MGDTLAGERAALGTMMALFARHSVTQGKGQVCTIHTVSASQRLSVSSGS